jgi:hypothetical protein
MWQQCLETLSDHDGTHFSAAATSLAKYSQYLFNLQQNIAMISLQQRMLQTTYEERTTAASIESKSLRHENVVLRSSALPPSKQVHKL